MLRTQTFRITERFSFVPADLVRKTETIKAGARFCKRKFTTQVRHVVVDGGDHRMKGKTDWWEIQRFEHQQNLSKVVRERADEGGRPKCEKLGGRGKFGHGRSLYKRQCRRGSSLFLLLMCSLLVYQHMMFSS